MRIAGLVIGILLVVLSVIGGIVCLMLPSITNNKVSFDEALLGLIPAVIIGFVGFIIAVVSAVLVIKARKKAVTV